MHGDHGSGASSNSSCGRYREEEGKIAKSPLNNWFPSPFGPFLFILKKTRPLGAIFVLPVMTGILVHHVTTDQSRLILSLVLMAINVLALVDSWAKYQVLLKDDKH